MEVLKVGTVEQGMLFAAVAVVPQATRGGHVGNLSRRCYSQNQNFGRVQPQTDFRRSEIEKPHFCVILATQVQSIYDYGLIL